MTRAPLRRVAAALPIPRPGIGALAVALAVAVAVIGAGAYGLRGMIADRVAPVGPPPAVTGRLAATLPSPAPDAGIPAAAQPAIGPRAEGTVALSAHPGALARPAGRATLPHTPRLSRIFRGAPPATPPARPSPDARQQQGTDTAVLRPRSRPGSLRQRTAERQAPQQFVSLRPRLRPADLDIPAAPRKTRRAPQAQPEAAREPVQRTAAIAARPKVLRTSSRCPRRLTAAMPGRARGAAGAHAIMARLSGIEGVTRDAYVTREILSGNMPGFLRDLRPVSLRGRAADGRRVTITLCVTPDYLAVGSDRDYTRIPLGLRAATRIGGAFGMVLPTPRMVDLIHRAADVRIAPRPMPAGPKMRSTDYLTRHNATVAAQISAAGASQGALISGHKKDVVLTNRLAERPGRVAIYGWHRANGEPIQPLSTVHGAGYADYSHGVRLVSRTAYLDGRPADLRDLLASPRYAALLSEEGPVTGPRLRMAALAAN
ncbi:hypothetical protein [Roseovarius ramblicola]|uniref:Uncharacterized protein n=1 Tax=Roseovarius ramblicola TaxID=2022336 RepID=A0ABV5I2B5_9RHOB